MKAAVNFGAVTGRIGAGLLLEAVSCVGTISSNDVHVRNYYQYYQLMTVEEFNEFCASLPAATYVCQWGGSDVWKVGGKVFAIGGWNDGRILGITFKVSDIDYEYLRDEPGMRPAPYLASRGFKWIQQFAPPGLPDEDLKHFLRESHRLASLNLTKKKQKELGLNQD